MSLLFKCFLGVVVALCFMQYVEMSRIRREEEKSTGVDVGDALEKVMTSVKNLLNDEQLKALLSSATTTLGETTQALQDQIKELATKITTKE